VADLLHFHSVGHPWLLLVLASMALLAGLAMQQRGLWLLARELPRDRRALLPADAQAEPRPGLG
jgi:hypothetical protein